MPQTMTILEGDCRERLREMPEASVHCVVTSPPYWGLRDYGVEGQMGLETTPDEYIAGMVEVFREVRRVLRADGVLWLNMGDSYSTLPRGNRPGDFSTSALTNSERQDVVPRGNHRGKHGQAPNPADGPNRRRVAGLKPKNLCGMPWRLAFALQADGWWLRSDVVWHKPNPMPESVADRPTKAHEYVFLLTRSARYFYDAEAVRENAVYGYRAQETAKPMSGRQAASTHIWRGAGNLEHAVERGPRETGVQYIEGSGRNLRSVWTISTKPFSGVHFATFPPELVQTCVLAGTSAKGCCPKCGAPWQKIINKKRRATRPGANSKVNRVGLDDDSPYQSHRGSIVGNRDPQRHCTISSTVGWRPGCKCDAGEPEPCTVLDPFAGAFTTGVVAVSLGRRFIGIELNPKYVEMGRKRLGLFAMA